MNKKLFLLILFTATYAFSQEYRLEGRVVNAEGEPIIFANVLLQKVIDTVLLKGASTDEKGHFFFDDILAGNYLLSASYIENTSGYLKIEVVADTQDIILQIDESAQALEEVVITYKKPTIERKPDRLIFNVANTALLDGSIWDLLKHTPSVSDIQGVLTIKGSSDITVMINERKINLPKTDIINLLSGASASAVESIEVITSPPSKYSAEGGMIIDIKMSKNLVSGYNGALFNRYRQGVFAKHTLGTDHYFKSEKAGLSLNYSFSKNKDLTRYTDITNFSENGSIASIWQADRDNIVKRERHNLSIFFDYAIDEKNALYMSSINSYSPLVNDVYDSNTLIQDSNSALVSSFETMNFSEQHQVNTSFYLDWTRRLKKKGAELTIGSHFTHFNSDIAQDLDTDFFDLEENLTAENNFDTQTSQSINLYSIQADYTTPISTSVDLEFGLRYAGIDSRNTISQQGFDRSQPGINPTEAGIFDYDESIYAAYTSLDGRWSKWKLKSGIRVEYTANRGMLDTNESANEVDYLEVFPNVSLQYSKGDKSDFVASYYRRIQRPRYDVINPFQYFRGNNTVVEGNPNLLPTILNNITLGYTYDNTYTLEFIYFKMDDKYNQQVFQDNESNLLRFISANLESNYSYGFDFTFNKGLTNYWNSRIILAYYFKQDGFNDLNTGQLVELNIESWFGRTKQSFTFLRDKSLFLDIDFMFRSPTINGNSRRNGYSRLGLLFRKNLWSKKGSLSLGVTDVFNKGNYFDVRDFLDQSNSTSTRLENRLFIFGFRYKFGNTGIKANSKGKQNDERKRLKN